MPDQTIPATPTPQPGKAATQEPVSVKFLFEKSPFYRTIHADGAWGRLDAAACIHLTFFNEKPQMPATGVMTRAPDGQWGLDQNKFQMAHDAPLVREVEFDVVMNVWSATVVRDVLTNFINMALAHMKEATEQSVAAQKQTK